MREHFPPMPEYGAEYMPIFYEPIIGSGERIVVAIAVIADDGEKRVHKTIDEFRLHEMFLSDKGPNSMIDFAIDGFKQVLEISTDSKWPPPNAYPISGFYDGPIRRTASDGMSGVLNQAIKMHCAFSRLIT